MNKRKLSFNNVCIPVENKKLNISHSSGIGSEKEEDTLLLSSAPNDTEAALLFLIKSFPRENFNNRIPPIIFVHQLYSIIKSKTTVDREIHDLQTKGKIRLFKLGLNENSLAVVFTHDLKELVPEDKQRTKAIQCFFEKLLLEVHDINIEKSVLRVKFNLSEKDISELVSSGFLTVKSASSYWFSIPSTGEFITNYKKGRQSILRTISKGRFGEILLPDLEIRPPNKQMKLGMLYHIHDVIGAELVTCIETTSGTILRPVNKKKK